MYIQVNYKPLLHKIIILDSIFYYKMLCVAQDIYYLNLLNCYLPSVKFYPVSM